VEWETVIVAVAANLVAIAAIVAGQKQNRATLEQQGRLADLSSVRDLIDTTAAHLHVVMTALNNVRLRLITQGQGFFESKEGEERPEGTQLLRQLSDAGDELDVLCVRLTVWLGEEHQAVVKLTELDEAVLAIWRALEGIRFNVDRQSADTDYGRRWVRDYFREQHEAITRQRGIFDAARVEFIRAAHQAAGAQLPAAMRPTKLPGRRVRLVRQPPPP
jgi:hypothetical protein